MADQPPTTELAAATEAEGPLPAERGSGQAVGEPLAGHAATEPAGLAEADSAVESSAGLAIGAGQSFVGESSAGLAVGAGRGFAGDRAAAAEANLAVQPPSGQAGEPLAEGDSATEATEPTAGARAGQPYPAEPVGLTTEPGTDPVAALLLAAGAGRRFGGPKALAELDGEPLVLRAIRVLEAAGCAPVKVVLGAKADEVRELLPDPGQAVVAGDWHTGMGASLRAGLAALPETAPAAVVHLVDLPWVGADVVRRVAGQASPDAVARAAYDGVPGHPVLVGRRWWAEIAESARGDRGARDWLAARTDLRLVECGDLGSGRDVDRRDDLPG